MEAGDDLIARARFICGSEHVLTAPPLLSVYRSDGVNRDGPLPAVVLLPATAAEVSALVRACADTGTPYVARGGGTSVEGGALPLPGAVTIALTRMRRILAIDRNAREITVEPGVTLASVANALAPSPLKPIDSVSTVGGHLAETAGLTNVTTLELVRAGGALVRLDARQPGYDVIGAFCGSRGHEGIAVAITLRWDPGP
jgi:glycolate oxidase